MKTRLLKLGLVVAGGCVALLLAEGYVRIFHPHVRDHVIPGGLFEIDSALGWRLQANRSVTHRTRYFDVAYRTDSSGARDDAGDPADAARTYRILLYGDSQVFGWGVAAGQRFSERIEQGLPGVDVRNLAVPGYGLDQQVLAYEMAADDEAANEATFFVSQATLERMHARRIYRKPKPAFVVDGEGRLTLVPVAPGSGTWTGLLYRTFSPLYLPYFVERLLTTPPAPPTPRGGGPAVVERVLVDRLTASVLGRATEIAERRLHRVSLIVSPELSVADRQTLREIGERRAIAVWELELASDVGPIRFGSLDPHWNPRAHRLIAEQLIGALASRRAGT